MLLGGGGPGDRSGRCPAPCATHQRRESAPAGRSGSPNFQRRRDASATSLSGEASRRPPHVVSPPCALASREDSAAPRTLRVHVAAAGTRRTGASPPAPTDHPTRKKKGKKSWRGAGRVGRVSQNSNRLGVPRETSEPLAGGGYRPRAPTRRPTSRGLSSRGASPGRFGVV